MKLCVLSCLQSMAELDKISHMQVRFKALIAYIFLKKLVHAPAILCRLVCYYSII